MKSMLVRDFQNDGGMRRDIYSAEQANEGNQRWILVHVGAFELTVVGILMENLAAAFQL